MPTGEVMEISQKSSSVIEVGVGMAIAGHGHQKPVVTTNPTHTIDAILGLADKRTTPHDGRIDLVKDCTSYRRSDIDFNQETASSSSTGLAERSEEENRLHLHNYKGTQYSL